MIVNVHVVADIHATLVELDVVIRAETKNVVCRIGTVVGTTKSTDVRALHEQGAWHLDSLAANLAQALVHRFHRL